MTSPANMFQREKQECLHFTHAKYTLPVTVNISATVHAVQVTGCVILRQTRTLISLIP